MKTETGIAERKFLELVLPEKRETTFVFSYFYKGIEWRRAFRFPAGTPEPAVWESTPTTIKVKIDKSELLWYR